MNERAEVKLEPGEFVLSMRGIVEYAKVYHRLMALCDATWEPHDWADFG